MPSHRAKRHAKGPPKSDQPRSRVVQRMIDSWAEFVGKAFGGHAQTVALSLYAFGFVAQQSRWRPGNWADGRSLGGRLLQRG